MVGKGEVKYGIFCVFSPRFPPKSARKTKHFVCVLMVHSLFEVCLRDTRYARELSDAFKAMNK